MGAQNHFSAVEVTVFKAVRHLPTQQRERAERDRGWAFGQNTCLLPNYLSK